ncbi:hypothetical protein [Paenibacillus ferrarius]|uniref:hypothetical protein n=1 Tax=Paenibacillus ferrarius TaxID=1469647 RepID=UPI003D271D85
MYAILLRDNLAYGYIQTTAEKAAEFECEFDLVDELPALFLEPISEGSVIIKDLDGNYTLRQLPPTPKSAFELLKEENEDLKSRVSDMELAFADIIAGL